LAVPILAAFDAPDPDAPCPVRFATTQPTQALGLINSEFANLQAKVFAEAARKHAGDKAADQVRFVLWRVLQREPKPAEIERGVKFIETSRIADKVEDEEALRRFCLIALNLNEFVYLEGNILPNFCGPPPREFLGQAGGGFTGVALAGLLGDEFFARQTLAADGQ